MTHDMEFKMSINVTGPTAHARCEGSHVRTPNTYLDKYWADFVQVWNVGSLTLNEYSDKSTCAMDVTAHAQKGASISR